MSVAVTERLAERLYEVAYRAVRGKEPPAWEELARDERRHFREAAEEFEEELGREPPEAMDTQERVKAVLRRGMDENRTAEEMARAIREELNPSDMMVEALQCVDAEDADEHRGEPVSELPDRSGQDGPRCIGKPGGGTGTRTRSAGMTEGMEELRRERAHQIEGGYDLLHDVKEHGDGELAQAAAVMALGAWYAGLKGLDQTPQEAMKDALETIQPGYPWIERMAMDHADSRERMLRVAVASAAAEIDRMRQEAKECREEDR